MNSIGRKWAVRLNERKEDTLSFIRNRNKLQLTIFIGPAVFIMFGCLILPLLYMLYMSFLNAEPPAAFTLENYQRMFMTDAYIQIISDTVVLTLQTTALVIVIGYAIAYGIQMHSKHERLLLMLVVLPFWTNYLVRNFSIIAIFQKGGPFDQLLNILLFFSEPNTVDILYTRIAVLIGLVYSYLPVAVLPIYASISRMDKSLISASKDLGAGPLKTFMYITLPETKDGIFVGTLLVSIPTLGAFVTPAMLGGPDDSMIGSLIQLQYMSVYDIPFGSALGTLTTVFILIALAFVFNTSGIPIIDNE